MNLKKTCIFIILIVFLSTGYSVACPPIDSSALWLPKDKKFAEKEFRKKAKKLNDSGLCVLEGSFGKSYQKYYITVSRSGSLIDAKILRFSYEDLKK